MADKRNGNSNSNGATQPESGDENVKFSFEKNTFSTKFMEIILRFRTMSSAYRAQLIQIQHHIAEVKHPQIMLQQMVNVVGNH